MKRILGWQRLDSVGLEYAEAEFEPLCLAGVAFFSEGGTPCVVTYRVKCDSSGLTTRAMVRLRRAGVASTRRIVRRADGSWTVDGKVIPQLAGLTDVDISVTPSTNTLPLRRLRLAIGERQEVTAAWVRFPSFDVVPLHQAYRRAAPNAYQYESHDLSFRAELTVDSDGLVERYGDLWTRL